MLQVVSGIKLFSTHCFHQVEDISTLERKKNISPRYAFIVFSFCSKVNIHSCCAISHCTLSALNSLWPEKSCYMTSFYIEKCFHLFLVCILIFKKHFIPTPLPPKICTKLIICEVVLLRCCKYTTSRCDNIYNVYACDCKLCK